MMTSDRSWSVRLRSIGEFELPDHHCLDDDCACAYFGEYTPVGNSGKPAYTLSNSNQKISNLKKPPSTRGTNQWKYKIRTIQEIGQLIRNNINIDNNPDLVFVPIPPSKSKNDPDYDSRMLDVARAIGPGVSVFEMLSTRESRPAASQSDETRSIQRIRDSLEFIDPGLPVDAAVSVILLDDVITTGATFVACKSVILSYLPNASVFGLFVARRVPISPFPDEDFDYLD